MQCGQVRADDHCASRNHAITKSLAHVWAIAARQVLQRPKRVREGKIEKKKKKLITVQVQCALCVQRRMLWRV